MFDFDDFLAGYVPDETGAIDVQPDFDEGTYNDNVIDLNTIHLEYINDFSHDCDPTVDYRYVDYTLYDPPEKDFKFYG